MHEIISTLKEFDRKRNWNTYETAVTKEEKLKVLYRQLVALMGEVGEFSNELKRCKHDNDWPEQKLKTELADAFIFLLKIAETLEMDLKQETLNKIRLNEERFTYGT